jgi:hypothetical protein
MEDFLIAHKRTTSFIERPARKSRSMRTAESSAIHAET